MRWILPILFAASLQAGEVEEVAAIASRYRLAKEVILDDSTRVDLLNDQYAIEADWSHKWAEGIGQAMFYAAKTGRRGGVLLIRRQETSETLHRAYLDRCKLVCEKEGLMLWTCVEGNSTVMLYYPSDPFR